MFGRNSLLSTAQVQRNPNEAVWLGSKVTDRTMHYAQVHDALPDFERRALSFSQPAGTSTAYIRDWTPSCVNRRCKILTRDRSALFRQPMGWLHIKNCLVWWMKLCGVSAASLSKELIC